MERLLLQDEIDAELAKGMEDLLPMDRHLMEVSLNDLGGSIGEDHREIMQILGPLHAFLPTGI